MNPDGIEGHLLAAGVDPTAPRGQTRGAYHAMGHPKLGGSPPPAVPGHLPPRKADRAKPFLAPLRPELQHPQHDPSDPPASLESPSLAAARTKADSIRAHWDRKIQEAAGKYPAPAPRQLRQMQQEAKRAAEAAQQDDHGENLEQRKGKAKAEEQAHANFKNSKVEYAKKMDRPVEYAVPKQQPAKPSMCEADARAKQPANTPAAAAGKADKAPAQRPDHGGDARPRKTPGGVVVEYLSKPQPNEGRKDASGSDPNKHPDSDTNASKEWPPAVQMQDNNNVAQKPEVKVQKRPGRGHVEYVNEAVQHGKLKSAMKVQCLCFLSCSCLLNYPYQSSDSWPLATLQFLPVLIVITTPCSAIGSSRALVVTAGRCRWQR